MKLLTSIPLQRSANPISYSSKVFFIGSCFSENIGNKLSYYKYQTLTNPFGILFHPSAIECCLQSILDGKEYTKDDIFKYNELWHCFDTHSIFSNLSPMELLKNINKRVVDTREYLEKSTHVIITLGTSWVYKSIEQKKIVANCHKVPQKEFKKMILEIDTIVKSLENINRCLRSLNSQIKIVYTVSPVRHLKDGFVENQRSKSHLISAVHQVLSDTVFYFPSYEIMIDELRGYRFYAEDMIHPNLMAINYIWDKFSEVWLDSCDQALRRQVSSIQKRLGHRSLNTQSASYNKFKIKLDDDIIEFKKKYPYIMF